MQLPQKIVQLQEAMQMESAEIKKIEAEFTKIQEGKRKLAEKKSENEMVMSEMNLITDDDAAVYKLVGPILAQQDMNEAKNNVKNRLEYITKELNRMEQ